MITKIVIRNLKNYKEIVFELKKKNDSIFFIPEIDPDNIIGFYKSIELINILKDIFNFIEPEYYLSGKDKFNTIIDNVLPGEILLFTIFYNYKEDDISLSFAISDLGILYEKLELNKTPIIEFDGEDVIVSDLVNEEDKKIIKSRYYMAFTKTGFYKSNSILISSLLETKSLNKYLELFNIPQIYYNNINKYDKLYTYLKTLSLYSKGNSQDIYNDIIVTCEKFLSAFFPEGEYKIDENNIRKICNLDFGKDINYFNIAGNGFCKLYWKLLILIGILKSSFDGVLIMDEFIDEGLHPKLSNELLKIFNKIGKDKNLIIITNLYDKGIDNSNNVNNLTINYSNYENND